MSRGVLRTVVNESVQESVCAARQSLCKKRMPYAISLMITFMLHCLNCTIHVLLMQLHDPPWLYDVDDFSIFV